MSFERKVRRAVAMQAKKATDKQIQRNLRLNAIADESQTAEEAWQHSFNDHQIFNSQGKFNRYKCESCGFEILTLDLVKGVTPFIIGCRREEVTGERTCPALTEKPGKAISLVSGGAMQSMFYRVKENAMLQRPTPDYVWFRPTLEEIKLMDEAMKEHVMQGGLLPRRLNADEVPS
ncbi:MAG: hypothetical protein ABI977_16550 [Acidobacteriota bacterium]